MKKLLVTALTLATLAACSKTDVIGEIEKDAITFGNSFVDNVTKTPVDPSLTLNTLKSFNVWGTLTNSAQESVNLFNNLPVIKLENNTSSSYVQGTGNWSYDATYTRYWVLNNTYKFAAIASTDLNNQEFATDESETTAESNSSYTTDAAEANKFFPSTIKFTTTDGGTDLLYASSEATPTTTEQIPDEVKFTFNHLLSKVKFTFDNKYNDNSGLFIEVENVVITNPYTSGTYTIANGGSWGSQNTTNTTSGFEFGDLPVENQVVAAGASHKTDNEGSKKDDDTFADLADIYPNKSYESANERLLIPGTYTNMEIKFKAHVWLKVGEQTAIKVSEYDYSQTGITASSITLQPGYSYNFKISLGETLDPIKFSVTEIKDWTLDGTGDAAKPFDVEINTPQGSTNGGSN